MYKRVINVVIGTHSVTISCLANFSQTIHTLPMYMYVISISQTTCTYAYIHIHLGQAWLSGTVLCNLLGYLYWMKLHITMISDN